MYGGSPQVPIPPSTDAYTLFRASLPVAALKETIIQTIADNQVTIISGETGSGKTTQVGATLRKIYFLYYYAMDFSRKFVILVLVYKIKFKIL